MQKKHVGRQRPFLCRVYQQQQEEKKSNAVCPKQAYLFSQTAQINWSTWSGVEVIRRNSAESSELTFPEVRLARARTERQTTASITTTELRPTRGVLLQMEQK